MAAEGAGARSCNCRLVRAQLRRLPTVDANDVVVGHCSNAPARRSFAVKQIDEVWDLHGEEIPIS
jgi:hypothetical protein